jgi:hypothetical protein
MTTHRNAVMFGWAFSLAMHGAMFGYVVWRTSAPELGLEFELPLEVEFGMTEAMIAAPAASSPPPEEAPQAGAEGEGEGQAGVDAGVPDAGVARPDAGRRQRPDAGPPEVASTEDGAPSEGGEGTGVAFLPAGSQLALRLDIARVRRSPLADDVRATLAAVPDWNALLDGSGISPLDDMDRLLVASPNLRRDRIIAAGRSNGDQGTIRAAAERLAASEGATLEWRTMEGVEVADWHNADATDRVIAIIGPQHFVIARPEDLPRVLSVARVRAADDPARGEGEEEPVHPADALLSMGEGEGLTLEVEGARNFARGQRTPIERIPTRLRVAFSEAPDAVALRIAGTYEDAGQATEAVAFWDRMREGYARNVIVSMLGFGGLLGRTHITAREDTLHAEVDMTFDEMRRLLGFARGMFEDRQRRQQLEEPPPMPEAPSADRRGADPPAPEGISPEAPGP